MAPSSTSRIATSASGLTCSSARLYSIRRSSTVSSTGDPGLVADLDRHERPRFGRWSRGPAGGVRARRSARLANSAASSRSRRAGEPALVVLGVGVDDAADEAVPHDVVARQVGEVDVVDLVQHAGHEPQARRALRQVDLRDVARDDHARAEAEAREEHLHLLGRGVLRLVEHDERVVERAAAHVGERCDLDRAGRHELRHDLGVHHLVERVVERPQVRVDLVVERAGQEPEPLPRLDGGPGQDDAADLLALQRLHGLRHREVGLARAGRADAEHDRVLFDRVDVRLLAEGLRPDDPAPRREDRLAEHLGRARAALGLQDAVRRRHVGRAEVVARPWSWRAARRRAIARRRRTRHPRSA